MTSSPRQRHVGRLAALFGALGAALLLPSAAYAAPVRPAVAPNAEPRVASPVAPGAGSSAEDATALVVAEDRRLSEVRRLSQPHKVPFRMGTASGYSLVLPARTSPYTVTDLLKLAPQTFLRLPDGSYQLSEHVVVLAGATLRLTRPGGLTVRLRSGSSGFVSLASLGGRIELGGAAGAPVVLTSWDPTRGAADTDTADGRAYVRVLGGQFDAKHVQASHLGFWSGRTGGIALTGADGLNTGAVDPGEAAMPAGPSKVTVQPAGPLRMPAQNQPVDPAPSLNYGVSRISDTVVDGNAYGLFVTAAEGVQVSNSTVRRSLIDGVVLHRYVTNGLITNTTSTDNTGDGFRLDRATTGVTLSGVTATGNTGSGISLSGRPLADGPSPSGSTTSSFGGNTVVHNTVSGNGQYGISVLGGFNIRVQDNRVSDHEMGIVVAGPAERITITGNKVARTARHGIAVTGGVSAAAVTRNAVDGAATGIYLRDSQAQVRDNTVSRATVHGVSLVGEVAGSDLGRNVLTGTGTGAVAVDLERSEGVITAAENRLVGWEDTSLRHVLTEKLMQPMTALWLLIGLLIILSAFRSRRRTAVIEHPYAHQMAHHGPLRLPNQHVIDLTGAASGRGGRS